MYKYSVHTKERVTMTTIDDTDLIDNYQDQGPEDDFSPSPVNTGVNDLWRPSSTVQRIRTIPSDKVSFQTYFVVAGNGTTISARPVKIAHRRTQGTASRTRIQIAQDTVVAQYVYLFRSDEDVSAISTNGTALMMSQGFCLGLTNSMIVPFEITTTSTLWIAAIVTAADGVIGATVSIASETFMAE